MPLIANAEDQALAAIVGSNPSGNLAAYASLHSTYGGSYSTALASELSGGSPAYARLALTWNTSGVSGGQLSVSGTYLFNVPGGSPTPTQVAFVGLWSVSSGGTANQFCGMGANGGFPAYAFTAATSGNLFTAPVASPPTYANGQAVVLWAGQGALTPGGFTVGQIYYVISSSGATFSLASTAGGSAITVTSAGSGLVQAVAVEQYAAQGNFTLSAETLSLQS